MKRISGISLIVLAIIMLFLGWKIQGLPPAVTGIGFLIIGLNYLKS
ncbi:MAG: hypothetical protein GW938_06230 [Leptospira sp.]|nr:hypothetical protein [Leptospira sp.]NCS92647.1 hypothetical protein [Leptospira sp.]